MAHKQRTISIWKLNHGLGARSGLMGQYGMESESAYAAQAMAPASAIWHQPSAALDPVRARIDPAALPNPSPIRKTARMIENV